MFTKDFPRKTSVNGWALTDDEAAAEERAVANRTQNHMPYADWPVMVNDPSYKGPGEPRGIPYAEEDRVFADRTAQTGPVEVFPPKGREIMQVTLSWDHKLFAWCDDKHIYVWDDKIQAWCLLVGDR